MDFHDEEIVMWRSNELGIVEEFCYSNILRAAPKKFRYGIWYFVLGIATVLSLLGSALLGNISPWIANMLGNIAAGLIASIILLWFTGAKEKSIGFYDQLLPKLSEAIECLSRAFNTLYLEERKLHNSLDQYRYDTSQVLEKYRVFSMKVFLAHKMLLDLIRQISETDKLHYRPVQIKPEELEKYEKRIDEYEKKIALDYSKNIEEHRKDYDTAYNVLTKDEVVYMRLLNKYVMEINRNELYWKYTHRR